MWVGPVALTVALAAIPPLGLEAELVDQKLGGIINKLPASASVSA